MTPWKLMNTHEKRKPPKALRHLLFRPETHEKHPPKTHNSCACVSVWKGELVFEDGATSQDDGSKKSFQVVGLVGCESRPIGFFHEKRPFSGCSMVLGHFRVMKSGVLRRPSKSPSLGRQKEVPNSKLWGLGPGRP